MKFLITGGAGFIGSHLADRLINNGHDVLIIDNLSTGKKININNKADFHRVDICDFKKIKPLFKNIDVVFHLAALSRVSLSMEDPIRTSETNILGTINVFTAASEQRVKRVVFTSSSSVYGNQKIMPMTENMKPAPVNPYALQKFTGEEFAKLFTHLYALPFVSLRYFNVYGPRTDFESNYGLVIGKFLKLNKDGKSLIIFGSGNQTRDFVYIDDVVDATILASQSSKIKGGEVLNIGSGKPVSINWLARLIGGKIEYFTKRSGDALHAEADITLAKKLLGWQSKTSIEEGLEKTKKWFRDLK